MLCTLKKPWVISLTGHFCLSLIILYWVVSHVTVDQKVVSHSMATYLINQNIVVRPSVAEPVNDRHRLKHRFEHTKINKTRLSASKTALSIEHKRLIKHRLTLHQHVKKQVVVKKLREKPWHKHIEHKSVTHKLPLHRNRISALLSSDLNQQLVSEEKQRLASDQSLTEIEKYKGLMLEAISGNWIVPITAHHDQICQFLIQLAPGGVVLSVQLVNSSGNPALDRSAQDAILKSSPLPVPGNEKLFNNFRVVRLTVKPNVNH